MKIATIILALLFSTSIAAAEVTLRDKAACAPDAFKYCLHLKDKRHEPGIANHVISCLMSHRSELRPTCAAVFTKNGM